MTLVPCLITFAWMTVFGDTALSMELSGAAPIAAAVKDDVSTAIYVMLAALPLSSLTSLLAATAITVFFITSSDSGSLVIDTITAGGKTDAPKAQRVFWCSFYFD